MKPANHNAPRRRDGMTLVEVMIAAALFTLLATGLTAAYVQNMRMAKAQSHRTQAINTALTIIEQLRANGYSDLRTIYHEPASPPAFVVKVLDPTQLSVQPTGYRDLQIPINVRDGVQLEGAWTADQFYVTTESSSARLPMRFWLSLARDAAETGDIHAVFRLDLIYQWRTPGGQDEWKTGNFRMAVPKLTVGTEDM